MRRVMTMTADGHDDNDIADSLFGLRNDGSIFQSMVKSCFGHVSHFAQNISFKKNYNVIMLLLRVVVWKPSGC